MSNEDFMLSILPASVGPNEVQPDPSKQKKIIAVDAMTSSSEVLEALDDRTMQDTW